MDHQAELARPLPLTEDQINFYRDNKFIKLKHVFSEDLVSYYNQVIGDTVDRLNQQNLPLQDRDTYGQAFLQLFNLWQHEPEIKKLVLSPRMGMIAAALMEVDGVRLYHDQALFKEAGGGITPWHADQYYWPLASDKTITAWIPLQATPLEMGVLEFSAGSHQIKQGRDMMISDESERKIDEVLRVTDFDHIIEPFDIGEVSFHSGWIFHRAGANLTEHTRKVMTIIYMDKDMHLKKPENAGQQNDWETWCPGAVIGEVIATPLNPLIYSKVDR